VGEQLVSVGVSASNVLDRTAPPALSQELLEARLQAELRRKTRSHLSEDEVARDWRLLQQAVFGSDAPVAVSATAHSLEPVALRSRGTRSNRP